MFPGKQKLGRHDITKASAEPDPSSSSGSPSFTTISPVAFEVEEPPAKWPSTVTADSGKGQDIDGDSIVASSDYAKKCKALMQLYRDLRSLGADMFDIELPKITVIGAQSAGKSSLIEAVSGISVPRDSGICTRCPVELSMASFVDEWKCTIELRIEYDPFGFQQDSSTLIPFCQLSSNEKQSVDLWLRRAQASILCRERPISDFQNMSVDELRRLKPGEGSMLPFSKNVIQVRLDDPEAMDLTFIDLPGLIQNASDDEISIAHNLVKKNIEGSTTLILVTIPMSDEMENQEAAKLARKTDPFGERTIGILTKPDTITRGAIGSRQRWKDVLQGKFHALRHGYYCVRLADDDERVRRLTRAESELLSANFFANSEPWNNFEDRSRFGIPNFVRDISQLLWGMIELNLPKLKVEVDQLVSKYSNEVRSMPSIPTGEPSIEILLRVSDFSRDLLQAVMGMDDKFLVQNNRAHYASLKLVIEGTEPEFWPFTSKKSYRSPGLHAGMGNVGPFDLEDVRKEIENATGWELGGIISPDVIKNIFLKSTSIWRSSTVGCLDSVFQTTSSAVEVLVARHFKQFTKLETLVKIIGYEKLDECKAKALDLIEKLLQHESEPLYTQNHAYNTERKSWLRRYTELHLNSSHYFMIKKRGTSSKHKTPSSDYSKPTSSAPLRISTPTPDLLPAPGPPSPSLPIPSKKRLNRKTPKRQTPSSDYSEPSSGVPLPISIPDSISISDSKDLSPVLSIPPPISRPPSPSPPIPGAAWHLSPHPAAAAYDDELQVMAIVSAYFHVASKRFVDQIPLAIEHQLNQFFAKSIQQALIENIMSGPDVAGRMKDLLSEDEGIVQQRQFLEKRLTRLKEIREKLFQFDMTSTS